MHDVLPWLDYQWRFDQPVAMFRATCERLRGGPVRLEELLRDAGATATERPATGKWSAQEHAGHLAAVERLWQTRIREYLAGATRLTAADMSNRATEQANFNELALDDVLRRFRTARADTMRKLDPLSLHDAGRVAHHPRLDRSMRLLDLCLFAAEHDDHHLALIHTLLAAGG